MSNTNRIVINTTTARRIAPVIIIPDAESAFLPVWVTKPSSATHSARAVVALSALGVALNQAFGVGIALAVILLFLPVLAGILTLAYCSQGEGSDSALKSAVMVALAAPALALPAASLGFLGALLGLGLAAVARALSGDSRLSLARTNPFAI